jgi:hypothetical protein
MGAAAAQNRAPLDVTAEARTRIFGTLHPAWVASIGQGRRNLLALSGRLRRLSLCAPDSAGEPRGG